MLTGPSRDNELPATGWHFNLLSLRGGQQLPRGEDTKAPNRGVRVRVRVRVRVK
jgi:hypothetical protein